MRLLVLGGAALGAQACRLARAMGARVLLADRDPACAAAAEADEFFRLDFLTEPLPAADYIIPATESDAALHALTEENVLFDIAAWDKTASRLAADRLLAEGGIPVPAYFPGGAEPYLVKPDRGSFGLGIWVTDDYCEVGGAVNAGFVTQEELGGPVWSAVAVGRPGSYTLCPPARLCFDDRRRRVEAVCETPPEAEALADTVRRTAELVGVRGVLEVEAMCDHGVWKVVDLNARIPMLTPDAILAAGGPNLISLLVG